MKKTMVYILRAVMMMSLFSGCLRKDTGTTATPTPTVQVTVSPTVVPTNSPEQSPRVTNDILDPVESMMPDVNNGKVEDNNGTGANNGGDGVITGDSNGTGAKNRIGGTR